MRDFKAFLADEGKLPKQKKIMVSKRFRNEKGEPLLWEIRAIRERENQEILRQCKNQESKEEYWGKLCAACVVTPNLENKGLWESYGTDSGDRVLKEMLSMGEYMMLLREVRRLNGFDQRAAELKEEAKN